MRNSDEPEESQYKRQRTMQTVSDSKTFTPREYQIEILKAAMEGNRIACLGTGTGKTFIAVLLIREFAHETYAPFDEGGRRIFFIVPTVPLVNQQAKVIEDHTELQVGQYIGEMNVDSWSKKDWEIQFQEKQVLLMTAEICRVILAHSFLSVSRMCLLIFDECHQARKNSPYREIMRIVSTSECEKPRIFGLSASLLNGKCKTTQLKKNLDDLEKTLTATIITASDYEDVQKYGTDPDEVMVLYKEDLSHDGVDFLLEALSTVEQEIKGFTSVFSEDEDYAEIEFFKKPVRCLGQLKKILVNFGPWFACCVANMFQNEIDKLLVRLDDNNKITMLKKVARVLDICIESCYSERAPSTNLPHKLSKLLEVFLAIKKSFFASSLSSRQSNDSPMCIIFMEERIIAYVMCQWIKEISSMISNYDFIKADFIVGHGAAGAYLHSRQSGMNVERQKDVLKRFRNKEFNILIATSVIEEGMDIQKCNIVIRFDLPKDFRAYVQSKGRARAAGSKYVMFVPFKDYHVFLEDICCYKAIEDFLLKKCAGREEHDEEEIKSHLCDELLPPYQPKTSAGSPRITLSSAIGLLNRYCAKLPCDMATTLTVKWKLKVVDPDLMQKEYICTLWLPINSPLRQAVTGQKMKRKKLAKMAAALKTCELLHKIGELNEHLLPISNAVDLAFADMGLEDEKSTDGTQPGTNRRRQLYEKRVADSLKTTIESCPVKLYINAIEMDLVLPLPDFLNPRKRPIVNPADSPRGFGILTGEPLPKLPKFPIFTKVGKIQVNTEHVRAPLSLNGIQLKELLQFHKFVFTETLWLEEEGKVFDPKSSKFPLLVVPLMKGEGDLYCLDWSFVKYTLNHSYHSSKTVTKPILRTNCEIEDFENSVVTRTYLMKQWHQERPSFHYVNKIRHDLTASGTFEDNKYKSFKEFYKEKYGIRIKRDDQPLLEADRCLSYNFTKPLYTSVSSIHQVEGEITSKTKQRHANFREILIPELSLIHPFPSDLFRKSTYLPAILYRLNHLLLAECIRVSVASGRQIGHVHLGNDFEWPTFHLESSDKEMREHFVRKGVVAEITPERHTVDIKKDAAGEIVSFEVKLGNESYPGPSPSFLLQALTTTSANDEFDLERMETIGDSFLKLAVSIKLYAQHPNFDEGKLTLLRSRCIRNLTLYQLAKKKQLAQSLVHTPFQSRMSWLPPYYDAEENFCVRIKKKETNDKQKPTALAYRIDKDGKEADIFTPYMNKFQLISDKCVADAMEALIGAYLLSCGYEGALGFMAWLGLDPYLEQGGNADVPIWPPKMPDPVINGQIDQSSKLIKDFCVFEKRLGYKFKNPAYLLQAFTHPSYYFNEHTDCFQRLEFLGDSILDYLITRKLFDDQKQHSPGQLTDLRSALVNNGYFASLAVKYGYHKNLKCLSIPLTKQIDSYITMLGSSEAYKNFEKYGYYKEEIECFNLEEVDIPKVLGDIFESVAGAIYLDNDSSIDAVWKVYYPMMKPAIDHLSQHVPKAPVRELLEMKPGAVFNVVPSENEEELNISLRLPSGREFLGTGPNKRVAKRSAAKRAVLYLREKMSKKMLVQT